MVLLPSCYNPPIDYFLEIKNCDGKFLLDTHEHFVKQTLRSRCHILSPNGIQSLIVPVKHTDRTHSPIKDIIISDAENWQKHHWKSLITAYNGSAFFEFYRDDFYPIYHQHYKYLIDLNTELLTLITSLLNINTTINYTKEWVKNPPSEDFRVKYSSKSPVGDCPEYSQVFSYKYGFTKGLSILDLIFNTGPQAHAHLLARGVN
jgi:WbqC-like protein